MDFATGASQKGVCITPLICLNFFHNFPMKKDESNKNRFLNNIGFL
jgi:hypothetical protein